MRRYLPLILAAALVVGGLALLSIPVGLMGAGVAIGGGWYLAQEVDE